MSRRTRQESLPLIVVCAALTVAVAAAGAAVPLAAQGQKLPITWSVSPTPVAAAAGEVVRVEVSAQIEDGWHLYSLTQPAPPDPTVISVPAGQPFTLEGTIEAPMPEKGYDEAQAAETEYYKESVSFLVPLLSAKTAKAGAHKVKVTARWQACNGSLCLRPQTTTLEVPIQIQPAK